MGRISKEEKQKKARNIYHTEWKKKNQKQYNIAFKPDYDSLIIQKLDSMEGNKADYIRQLILADIEKESKKNG